MIYNDLKSNKELEVKNMETLGPNGVDKNYMEEEIRKIWVYAPRSLDIAMHFGITAKEVLAAVAQGKIKKEKSV